MYSLERWENVGGGQVAGKAVEKEAGLPVAGVGGVAEAAQDGGARGGGPIQGGVDKPLGFINREGQFSSGNRASGVDKPGAEDNERDRVQVSADEQNELGLSNVPAVANNVLANAPTGFPPPAPFQRGGRPTVFTPVFTEKLCMLLSVGFSRNQAAAYLCVDKSSISRAAARDPELAAELRRAEEISDIHPELTLMAAARKNWRAAAWYLTFKAKHPRPKTEEEKEAEHEQWLLDERRRGEQMRAALNSAKADFDPLSVRRDRLPAATNDSAAAGAQPRKGERRK